jgi:uncharacterized protein (DUF983 family)
MDSPANHMTPKANPSQPLLRLIWRALRLRCPSCGHGKLFRGWFAMHGKCGLCDRPFSGDEGYFLGSIYFNYGVTGVLVVSIYFAMYFGNLLTDDQRLALMGAFVVLFPVWFFAMPVRCGSRLTNIGIRGKRAAVPNSLFREHLYGRTPT